MHSARAASLYVAGSRRKGTPKKGFGTLTPLRSVRPQPREAAGYCGRSCLVLVAHQKM